MRKVFIIAVSLVLIISLSGCKRKNKAKNLQIVEHSNNAYVIKYCATKLDFGDFYILIEDEKLIGFYTINKTGYSLKEYYLKINDNSANLIKTETNEKDGLKIDYKLSNPLKLITSVNDNGKENVNENSIEIHVLFVDSNNIESFITLNTIPKDLVEFIRNKKIK